MSKRILMGVAALLLAVSVTFLVAAPVLAMDARGGDTVTVASGEVVDDDLYVAGGDIIIDGTVNGDIFGVGRTFTINGIVNGAVTFAGQTMTVNGEIARSARLAGQTVNVSGSINGDLVAAGAAVNIASTAEIGGDLLVGAGNVRIDGLIQGDVKGGGGEVTIAGEVRGDVELEVDSLTIEPTANIEGDLFYTSENEANIQSGAWVRGTTTHNVPEVEEPAGAALAAGIASAVMGKVIGFLMILVVGIIIILTVPRRMASVADSVRTKPWPSLGWGAVILFATPIAAIIVCFTVIGIPVGLIALALYGIGIYLSQIPVALLIGRLIFRRLTEVESKGLLVGALALGLVILVILRLIPFLGFWIGLATALFGLGAVVVSEKRLRAEA